MSALGFSYGTQADSHKKQGPEESHPELAVESHTNLNPKSFSQAEYLYRPTIHFSPPVGFMNDPNGLIFDGNQYHLYYQYDPLAPYAGHVHWGHAVSKDLYTWQDLPTHLRLQKLEKPLLAALSLMLTIRADFLRLKPPLVLTRMLQQLPILQFSTQGLQKKTSLNIWL